MNSQEESAEKINPNSCQDVSGKTEAFGCDVNVKVMSDSSEAFGCDLNVKGMSDNSSNVCTNESISIVDLPLRDLMSTGNIFMFVALINFNHYITIYSPIAAKHLEEFQTSIRELEQITQMELVKFQESVSSMNQVLLFIFSICY